MLFDKKRGLVVVLGVVSINLKDFNKTDNWLKIIRIMVLITGEYIDRETRDFKYESSGMTMH